jgi:hypothetical protein
MASIMSLDEPIPHCVRRGTVAEALDFFKCEYWGGCFDARDYGAVLDHEEPLPHLACDQVQ